MSDRIFVTLTVQKSVEILPEEDYDTKLMEIEQELETLGYSVTLEHDDLYEGDMEVGIVKKD